jgi:hypothetical protein
VTRRNEAGATGVKIYLIAWAIVIALAVAFLLWIKLVGVD